jgi:hypothetical protein
MNFFEIFFAFVLKGQQGARIAAVRLTAEQKLCKRKVETNGSQV